MEYRICATETYEPSFCISSWKNRISEFDMVLYITKTLNQEVVSILTSDEFLSKMSVVHLTCTGWGGSFLEPNVVSPEMFQDKSRELIRSGYPLSRIVWRIDPIIPTDEGIERFQRSFSLGYELGIRRFRSSVMQLYKHSYERLKSTPIIGDIDYIYNGKFFPDKERASEFFSRLKDVILDLREKYPDARFESCASACLMGCGFENVSCMSCHDFELNGVSKETVETQRGFQRTGCGCLLKQQLIPGGYKRGRCPNRCLYCYLKDSNVELPESSPLF